MKVIFEGSHVRVFERDGWEYIERKKATEGVVVARDGSRIAIPFDTICIHADMEHAAERLRAIRAAIGR